ncbi:accessory Sec system translocase SecA2 [Enterococcus gallinarum]|uniref:accessory Sec system translocase SecA2 n=1 Tax=Enterococcus gallinarum TaxID=1353 RepID=UPI003D6A89CA
MKDKKFRKYMRLARKVQNLADKYRQLSDQELQMQTILFRQQLELGKKLESILPQAYAVVVEADRRVLGMEPYFVQILGAIALFYGNVAEMKTGEGKTLTATMPMYLHGLGGKGNFLITSNTYLALRDIEETGKVYRFLGLTVAAGVPEHEDEGEEVDKEVVYAADIVYTTHSALGFDYLFDNLAVSPDEQYVTHFNYVLIDEIDAILLDMAQTPLIISGAPKVQSNFFTLSDWFVKSLIEGKDYLRSENKRHVWFTETGIQKAEDYLGIENILSEKWKNLYRHLVIALRANYLLHLNKDYVVEDNEILLLDEANGRKLIGTKLQAGLHQAIEAKEGVEITTESRSMGSITYQNLFRKFKILSGMTGTAKTDADEFRETYNIDVIEIPTNKPIRRKDHQDLVYVTNQSKIMASLEAVKNALIQERPVLIETGSVSMSTLYSLILLKHRIPHNLLNATTATKESWIISEAGKKGAVTVATSMAGRGTDIKLEQDARENGGLLVVGTERMTSDRIDNQLRGRSGRQGDPGDSIFYVSMEDKIVVESAPKWAAQERELLTEQEKSANGFKPLKKKKYNKLINQSQSNRKNQEIAGRQTTLEFDSIITIQRDKMYSMRNSIMTGTPVELEKIFNKCMEEAINQFITKKENLNKQAILDFIFNNLDYNFDIFEIEKLDKFNKRTVKKFLLALISDRLTHIQQFMPDSFQQLFFKRIVLLKALDTLWIEQSDNLQQLKTVINGRNWGQHRPIYEFQVEAHRSFTQMREAIYLESIRNLLLSELVKTEDGSFDVEFP